MMMLRRSESRTGAVPQVSAFFLDRWRRFFRAPPTAGNSDPDLGLLQEVF